MFKNLHILRIAPGWTADAAQAEERLAREAFTPCGATQPESAGWVPPRGTPHAPLVEVVNGQWLLALMMEKKLLPASVVKDRCAEISARLEQERGYKPGRREAKEIKEQAAQELLPLAFVKRARALVWIDPRAGLLAIDAGAAAQADAVVSLLVKALDGFNLLPLQTQQSPAGCMAAWLAEGEAPGAFYLDRECELKSADEMRSVVRYARHALDTDEAKQHIAAGKRPTRLALSWSERVAFTLTDALTLKKIEILDTALGGPRRRGRGRGVRCGCGYRHRRAAPHVARAVGGAGRRDAAGRRAGRSADGNGPWLRTLFLREQKRT